SSLSHTFSLQQFIHTFSLEQFIHTFSLQQFIHTFSPTAVYPHIQSTAVYPHIQTTAVYPHISLQQFIHTFSLQQFIHTFSLQQFIHTFSLQQFIHTFSLQQFIHTFSLQQFIHTFSLQQFIHTFSLQQLVTLSLSYMVGTVASFHNTTSVVIAMGATLVISFTIIIFSAQTRVDFTICNGIIIILAVDLLMFGFFSIFYYSSMLQILYGCLGALLYSLVRSGKHAHPQSTLRVVQYTTNQG
uniref:Si:ch211-284o19.8 n=1 Tax=Astyanax mexicanus TaxID=7994 RepID=A0A3B1J8L1_ASTMX